MAAGGYVPSKFGSMEDWLVTSYEGLIEQAAMTAGGVATLSPAARASSLPQDYHHDMDQPSSSSSCKSGLSESDLKAAIQGHPKYKDLVRHYTNVHKIGAPADMAAEIEKIAQNQKYEVNSIIGANPELDQFMVAYCNVLTVYESRLQKVFKEAIDFCKKQEQKLSIIAIGSIDAFSSAESSDDHDDFGEESDITDVEVDVDPLAGDKELKQMLMRKYGAFIKGLTQEYLKKKKKGKLPKESRQQLLDWWSQHQDHPYPTENQKSNLAHSTGLDPKQINNWFINQRKRHWNPAAVRGESSQQQQDSAVEK